LHVLGGYFSGKTVEQLKNGIEQSTPEERLYLIAFLKHLARRDDPAYRSDLTRLNQEINDGRRFSLAQVKRLDETLRTE